MLYIRKDGSSAKPLRSSFSRKTTSDMEHRISNAENVMSEPFFYLWDWFCENFSETRRNSQPRLYRTTGFSTNSACERMLCKYLSEHACLFIFFSLDFPFFLFALLVKPFLLNSPIILHTPRSDCLYCPHQFCTGQRFIQPCAVVPLCLCAVYSSN